MGSHSDSIGRACRVSAPMKSPGGQRHDDESGESGYNAGRSKFAKDSLANRSFSVSIKLRGHFSRSPRQARAGSGTSPAIAPQSGKVQPGEVLPGEVQPGELQFGEPQLSNRCG